MGSAVWSAASQRGESAASMNTCQIFHFSDEAASVSMVLCVASVEPDELILTDGWYCLACPIPPAGLLARLVTAGRVRAGVKLVVAGAELTGEPAHPLAATRKLTVAMNSTRRAVWWARLGRLRSRLTCGLAGLRAGEGAAPQLRLAVVRRYPLLYRVTRPGQPAAWLTEREWEAEERAGNWEIRAEQLAGQVEVELREAAARAAGRPIRLRPGELARLECGERLAALVEEDPVLVADLTAEQTQLVERARASKREQLRAAVEAEMTARLANLPRPRASPVQRLRLAELGPGPPVCSALLTVWRPGPAWAELREGQAVLLAGCEVTRVTANPSTAHLTVGRNTRLEPALHAEGVGQVAGRLLTPLTAALKPGFCPLYGEVDCVVAVVGPGPGRAGWSGLTVTDGWACAQLLYWGGQSEDPVLRPGRVVSCTDLEWRPETSPGRLPALYLTQRSSVSGQARQEPHRTALAALLAQLPAVLAGASQCLDRQVRGQHPSPAPAPAGHRPSNAGPALPSAWTRRPTTQARMEKLDLYTSGLGQRDSPRPALSRPGPTRKLPPFKPPARLPIVAAPSADAGLVGGRGDSSQEMEDFAMEVMDQLEM